VSRFLAIFRGLAYSQNPRRSRRLRDIIHARACSPKTLQLHPPPKRSPRHGRLTETPCASRVDNLRRYTLVLSAVAFFHGRRGSLTRVPNCALAAHARALHNTWEPPKIDTASNSTRDWRRGGQRHPYTEISKTLFRIFETCGNIEWNVIFYVENIEQRE